LQSRGTKSGWSGSVIRICLSRRISQNVARVSGLGTNVTPAHLVN